MASNTEARGRERRSDYGRLPAPLRRRGKVVVVDGFGVSLRVERGRLVLSDGAGRERRERSFTRSAHGISRLVVLGGSGSLSLAALRWCSDLGIPVLVLDRDGRILSLTTPTSADAHLRRAQTFAVGNETGLEIARFLLGAKLDGQRALLPRLAANEYERAAFEDAPDAFERSRSLNDLVMAERDAAFAYWSAWGSIAVRFRAADREEVPGHWLVFGQRGSSLTGSNRLATNPINSMLNYLYALLEAETTIALHACGLDPSLGIVHADVRGRDSLALDVMEAVRPAVDSYVLDLLENREFRASDFYETRKGSCRVLPPLTHALAETAPAWGRLVAPVAERVAALLAESPGARINRVPTPLTSANRKHAHAHHRRTRAQPLPPVLCKLCGRALENRDRTYCDACAALPQSERYASTLGIEPAGGSGTTAQTVKPATGAKPRTSRRCKRCGDPVSHRKRVLCDSCFVAFRRELAAQRRPCTKCGQPVPHRKRILCDTCIAGGTSPKAASRHA